MACRWLGDSDAMFRSLQRAYRLHVGAGDRRGGARVAVQLALGDLYFHGDVAIARGWLERADGLLTTVEPGSEHGWLALMRGHIALQFDKDPDSARRQAAAALAIGRACGLVGVEMTALALEGLAMVSAGERDEGMRRLDQATAAAVAGELGELDAVSTTCCYLIDGASRWATSSAQRSGAST